MINTYIQFLFLVQNQKERSGIVDSNFSFCEFVRFSFRWWNCGKFYNFNGQGQRSGLQPKWYTVKYSFLYSEGDLREKYHVTAALRSYGVRLRSVYPYGVELRMKCRLRTEQSDNIQFNNKIMLQFMLRIILMKKSQSNHRLSS